MFPFYFLWEVAVGQVKECSWVMRESTDEGLEEMRNI